MIGVLKADFLKLRKRWLYWTLIIVLAVLLGLSAAILLIVPEVSPGAIPELPKLNRSDALILGAQQAIGQTWFPLILAVVFLGGELSSSVWASELTRESRRWVHLLSKVLILTVASWMAMVVATSGWALLAAIFTDGAGLGASAWLAIIWKASLIQLTWVALGLGAISVLRSTGISIGLAIAFSFLEGLGALWEPYRNVSLTTASTALMGTLETDISGGLGFGFTGSRPLDNAPAAVGLGQRDP